MDAEQKSPGVLLSLGCDEAIQTLQGHGYAIETERSWQELIRRTDLAEVQGLLVHTKVEGTGFFEIALPAFCEQWTGIDVLVWSPGASPSFVHTLTAAGAKEVVLAYHPDELVERVRAFAGVPAPKPKAKAAQPAPEAPAASAASVPGNRVEVGAPSNHSQLGDMRSRSPKMWDIFSMCRRVAPTDATVLILGETGTGKELLARAVHQNSGRSGPFVVLNCGAVPENLVDSELFGHVKGAFTGADQHKMGLFRHADGGTILLDEIGNIPLEVQFRLLRVLQEGAVRPVGGPAEIPVDVRVIAATNAPLEAMIRRGQFREDLYYRLNVIPMILPSLRERPEDVFFLFAHFLRQQAEQYGFSRPAISDGFLDQLQSHPWPGNVRQLENFTERLLLTHMGDSLTAADFARLMQGFAGKDEFGRTSQPIAVQAPPAQPPTPAPMPPQAHQPTYQPPHQAAHQPAYQPAVGGATMSMPAMGSSVVQPSQPNQPGEPPAQGNLQPAAPVWTPAVPAIEPPVMVSPQAREQLLSEGNALADESSQPTDGLGGSYQIDPALSLADNVAQIVEEIEQKYIDACMNQFAGRVIKTAEHAGINRRTLLRKLKKYGIDKHDYRGV